VGVAAAGVVASGVNRQLGFGQSLVQPLVVCPLLEIGFGHLLRVNVHAIEVAPKLLGHLLPNVFGNRLGDAQQLVGTVMIKLAIDQPQKMRVVKPELAVTFGFKLSAEVVAKSIESGS